MARGAVDCCSSNGPRKAFQLEYNILDFMRDVRLDNVVIQDRSDNNGGACMCRSVWVVCVERGIIRYFDYL